MPVHQQMLSLPTHTMPAPEHPACLKRWGPDHAERSCDPYPVPSVEGEGICLFVSLPVSSQKPRSLSLLRQNTVNAEAEFSFPLIPHHLTTHVVYHLPWFASTFFFHSFCWSGVCQYLSGTAGELLVSSLRQHWHMKTEGFHLICSLISLGLKTAVTSHNLFLT